MILMIDKLTVRIPLRQGGMVHSATNISLTLERGKIHALIGESGCGKSTIAQAITGLLPATARVTGKVVYSGQNILGKQNHFSGRHIALIPQSAATFLTPVRTVGAQLAETIAILKGSLSPEQLMVQVDLDPDVLELYPHEISGGMAQRAAVAFALAGAPDIVIADEPTASLDPERKAGMFRLLRQIANHGTAVMLITHDISALVDTGVADRVSVCYASRIVESGEAKIVLKGGAQSRYTQDLLAALPRNGLHRMPGRPPELTNLADDYTYETRLALSEEAQCRV